MPPFSLPQPAFPKKGEFTAKGFTIVDLPAGNYTFTLTAPGFTTVIGTLKALEGSLRQKTLKLAAYVSTGTITIQKKEAI